jgi:hypothetical protein
MNPRGKKLSSFIFSRHHYRQSTLLRIEELETRNLFSAGGMAGLGDIFAAPDRGGLGRITNQFPLPTSYTPAQISHAYGFDQIQGNGAGQTIAIVDAYDNPNIFHDLDVFDNTFGLPGPASSVLTKATPEGNPRANANWAGEIALDVEWAHAIAPGAHILLVEAASASLPSLLNAVSYAAAQPGVVAVSMSWGGTEFSSETSFDSQFATPGITYVASAGDSPQTQFSSGAIWPSTSPNVLSVGGTSLNGLDKAGNYSSASETAWSSSGGGTSSSETAPSYQSGLGYTGRATPDVSFDADPNTGVAIYDSVSYLGQAGWFQAGGTSLGAPAWAALVAIADQVRGSALSTSQTLTALYSNRTAFNDVTSGTAGINSAGQGYDLVTGLGTPKAGLVVQALAGAQAASKSASVVTTGTASAAKNSGATGKPTMITDSPGDSGSTGSSSSGTTSVQIPTNLAFIILNSSQPSYYTYASSFSSLPTYTFTAQTALWTPISYSNLGLTGGPNGGFLSTTDYRRGALGPVIPTESVPDQTNSAPQAQPAQPQNSDAIPKPETAPGDAPALPSDSSEKDKGPSAPANKKGDTAPGDGFWELGLAADGVVRLTKEDAPVEILPDAPALIPGLVAFLGSSWGMRLIDPNAGQNRPKLLPK